MEQVRKDGIAVIEPIVGQSILAPEIEIEDDHERNHAQGAGEGDKPAATGIEKS